MNARRLPRGIVIGVVVVSLSPAILQTLGVDFGSTPSTLDTQLSGSALTESVFKSLSGAFTHTILEWSAFSVAFFTVVLAFTHFVVKRSAITPVIALALFTAGCMDAFHTLAADRLIDAATDNRQLVPFTWALCRLFNSVICATGVGLFLIRRDWGERYGARFVAVVAMVFGLMAYIIIHYAAAAEHLPKTQYSGMITRPWDVGPFLVFLASAGLFAVFYRRHPSIFAHSLLVSTIADLAVQGHMAFGSSALFDSDFNVAHFLKIVAYAVPCLGLVLDYIQTHQQELATLEKLERARESLELSKVRLERSNEDLQHFAYVASHDLKAPLRGVSSVVGWIEEDLEDGNLDDLKPNLQKIKGRVARLENLIDGVLRYSRVDQAQSAAEPVKLQTVIDRVVEEVVESFPGFELTVDGPLPEVETNPILLEQVVANLVTNAIKHHDQETGHIRVTTKDEGHSMIRISISDDGPGIAPEYREKVFGIFETLKARDKQEGSGIGLALVKKIVQSQGGQIALMDNMPRGARFELTWPKRPPGISHAIQ